MKNVVIIGPAWPLRGGLATFDQRLAEQFQREGHSSIIYSFSLQYPSFLFPGKTQYSSDPAPENIRIVTAINSINPFNWLAVGRRLKKLAPDIIVVRFWLPFMGAALGTILRVAANKSTRIIAITDNIVPHEKRPGDRLLTKYFLGACHAFITMSEKVFTDLKKFEKHKPALQVVHPLYDNFGAPVGKHAARERLALPNNARIVLFFGFIRKYKGLDILLDAMKLISGEDPDIRLLIAGEFYEPEQPYHDQIARLGIAGKLIMRTNFIADSEVRDYLCAADLVVQPYRHATQSGVTPLAYHFEKPMVVTNVGSLPAMVPHEKAGLVCEPQAGAVASAIMTFFALGEEHFLPHLRREKEKYSWSKMTSSILTLTNDIPK